MKNTKQNSNALSAVFWSFIQRGGSLIISFLANIVLARLLSPEDFGCIGILLVFVCIADILVDGGLGASLIHKKDISNKDICTVFTSNFALSSIIFVILFIFAPYIALYFNIPNLDKYLRLESVAIIFRAFYVVQTAILTKELKFKDIAKVNIIASVCGSSVGIIMASLNLGVLSLIGKNLTHQLMLVILYRIKSKVPSKFGFNIISFNQLFKYGWFVALTSFMDLIHSNIASFIIGKSYSVKNLGYYNQAYSLQQIPTYSISMVINQVLFPYMSKVNNDNNMVNNYAKRVTTITAFAVLPIMIFLIFFAKPVIIIIYSAKWLPAATYFQVLCIGGLFNAFIHINRNILKSIGETRLLFKIQFIITIIGIILLIIACNYSIMILISSIILCSIINWITISVFAGSKIGYIMIEQIHDIFPSFIISLTSGIGTFLICNYIKSHVILITMIATLIFFSLYFFIHYLFKTQSLRIIVEMVFPNRKIYGKKSL